MQQLIDALAARLPAGCVRLGTSVERIEPLDAARGGSGGPVPQRAASGSCAGWRLWPRGQSPEEFDGLILATPAPVSARLLQGVDDELARLIASIPHAGCSVAVLGVRRDQVAHPLDGFGFIVPAVERRQILAGSMASIKFPGRAPEGKLLLRVFVGGALQPELNAFADDQLRALVVRELGELIGLRGDAEFCDVVRWQGAMPQYHVGHLDLAGQIEARAAAIPHFALAGNAYRGVGIPFCVRSGEAAAERIVAALAAGPRA
jgi:oxygen-dependent protoporphyrinogen oxidase